MAASGINVGPRGAAVNTVTLIVEPLGDRPRSPVWKRLNAPAFPWTRLESLSAHPE